MRARKVGLALGGGGARGALQVGALRALVEAGIEPDFVVGTSIGSINAAMLGLHGATKECVHELELAWRDAQHADLLPSNYVWLTVRSLFGRGGNQLEEGMRTFLDAHGVTRTLQFGQLRGLPVYFVAADLNSGRSLLYGKDPKALVIDGIMASAALPPWVQPKERDDSILVDGGTVSNVPVEAALGLGATEVIALDVAEPLSSLHEEKSIGPWLNKLIATVQRRHLDLELALAEALQVPVRYIWLRRDPPIPVWDFEHSDELIATGYTVAKSAIESWRPEEQSRRSLRSRLAQLAVWTGRRTKTELQARE